MLSVNVTRQLMFSFFFQEKLLSINIHCVCRMKFIHQSSSILLISCPQQNSDHRIIFLSNTGDPEPLSHTKPWAPSTLMHLQKCPFSSWRNRSKIYSSTLAFLYSFHQFTLKRSKTRKTSGTWDCACINITRPSAVLDRC